MPRTTPTAVSQSVKQCCRYNDVLMARLSAHEDRGHAYADFNMQKNAKSSASKYATMLQVQ